MRSPLLFFKTKDNGNGKCVKSKLRGPLFKTD